MPCNQLHRRIILVLCVILIFWLGRLSVQYQLKNDIPSLQPISEVNSKIPMVTITDIEDAKIFGSVNRPEIRLRSGDQVAVPDQDLNFELSIRHLGFLGERPVQKVTIPEGAQFVASKQGKYFYDVEEKAAYNLSPENLIFFKTEQEALTAGYQKRQR